MLKGRQVSVIGAGIAGLAAARALAMRGAVVRVFEQAAALEEVGAGIQISANGRAVLDALGVEAGEAGLALGEGTRLVAHDTGAAIHNVPPPGAGATLAFHRADLLATLEKGAREVGADLMTGMAIGAIDPAKGEITTVTGEVIGADIVVAADGLKSLARREISSTPRAAFAGQVAWRAIVPWEGDAPPRATVAMGPGRHVVTYPLRGGTAMNLAAFEERSDWQEEGWRIAGDPVELRRRFSDFGGLAGEVLAKVRECHLWALHLHPVAERWSNGRACLIGDAAHPTLPYLAQGACMALEDAWVLAEALDSTDDLAAAFGAYEAARKPRVKRVVAAAQANAGRFHMSGLKARLAHILLRRFGSRIAPDFNWIFGHDVTEGSAQAARDTQTGT